MRNNMHTQSYTPKSHKTTSKQSWKSKLTNLLAQSILMQDGIVASSAAAHWLVLSSWPAISNTSTPQCHRFSLSDATACPCSNWRTETGSMILGWYGYGKNHGKNLEQLTKLAVSLPETYQVVPFLVFWIVNPRFGTADFHWTKKNTLVLAISRLASKLQRWYNQFMFCND